MGKFEELRSGDWNKIVEDSIFENIGSFYGKYKILGIMGQKCNF